MSKKMANKILAAVLSLGAVMGSGGIGSAMEKNETKSLVSRRSFLTYGSKGVDFLKNHLDFKDIVYLLMLGKVYSKLRAENVDFVVQLVDKIGRLSEFFGTIKDTKDYRRLVFFECVKRLRALDKEKKYNNLSIPILTKKLVSNICGDNENSDGKFILIESDENIYKNSDQLYEKVGLDGDALSGLKVLRGYKELSKFILKYNENEDNVKDKAEKMNNVVILTEDLSFLFKVFTFDEIFDAISKDGDRGILSFVKALFYFNALSEALNDENNKSLVKDRQTQKNLDFCASNAKKFLDFCENKLKKISKSKEDSEKNTTEIQINENYKNYDDINLEDENEDKKLKLNLDINNNNNLPKIMNINGPYDIVPSMNNNNKDSNNLKIINNDDENENENGQNNNIDNNVHEVINNNNKEENIIQESNNNILKEEIEITEDNKTK